MIFLKTKNKPLYIERESLNSTKKIKKENPNYFGQKVLTTLDKMSNYLRI